MQAKTYVYDGDLVLSTVEDVAAAAALVGDAETFIVAGNLKINAPTLGNAELKPLTSKITAVRGSAMIANTKTFTCLATVFANLAEVGYSMTLRWNEGLVSVCGLDGLTVGGTVSILSDSAPMRIPQSLKSAAGKKHGDFLACDAPKAPAAATPAAREEAVVVKRVVRDATSTEWTSTTGGEWIDNGKWTDEVPCGGRTAIFPQFDDAAGAATTYVVELSAETHPVGALSMAPGSKIELQTSTVLDFGAEAGTNCPKRTTITATTTTIFDPANIDCEETLSACTAACEKKEARTYAVQVQPVAAGRACKGATDCEGGEDLCPVKGGLPGVVTGSPGTETADVSALVPAEAAAVIVAKLQAMMSASSVSMNLMLNGAAVEMSGAEKNGDAVVLSFAGLKYADLSEADKVSLMSQVLVEAGKIFGFTPAGANAEVKASSDGSTDVELVMTGAGTVPGTDESADDSGFPVGAIGGAAGGLVVILIIVMVVVKSKGSNDGLPTSMGDGGITVTGDDTRAVQNPLYEAPGGPEGVDGYMEVTN